MESVLCVWDIDGMSEEEPQEKSLFKKVVWHPFVRVPVTAFFVVPYYTFIFGFGLMLFGCLLGVIIDWLFGTDLDTFLREIYVIQIFCGTFVGAGVLSMVTVPFVYIFPSLKDYIQVERFLEV